MNFTRNSIEIEPLVVSAVYGVVENFGFRGLVTINVNAIPRSTDSIILKSYVGRRRGYVHINTLTCGIVSFNSANEVVGQGVAYTIGGTSAIVVRAGYIDSRSRAPI